MDCCGGARTRVRRLDRQGLARRVPDLDSSIGRNIDGTSNAIAAQRLKAQRMTVHVDDHRVRLVVAGRPRIERGDDRIAALVLCMRFCRARRIVLRERLRLLDFRCRRRLGHGRIDVVRLSRRLVKGQPVRLCKGAGGGGGRQPLADLDLEGEIAAVCRCIFVVELVCKRLHDGRCEVLLDRRA